MLTFSTLFTANVSTVLFNDITCAWLAFSTYLIWSTNFEKLTRLETNYQNFNTFKRLFDHHLEKTQLLQKALIVYEKSETLSVQKTQP